MLGTKAIPSIDSYLNIIQKSRRTMTTKSHTSLPADGEQFKSIDRTMQRLKYRKDALLEVLNVAQENFGYLSEDLLRYVAQGLGLPLAKVYGVATFYQLFSFEPLGKYNCIVCTGTACHVKGSEHIAAQLSSEIEVLDGQTTPEGLFSLSTARCVGSCGIAPVVILDGTVRGKETPERMLKHVQTLLRNHTLGETE
jgi:bidirectional [NiFe] hydrogenase diaphorase subunit